LDLEKKLNIKYVTLDNLLLARAEDTYHLISESQLMKMKKTAFLINTSRGPVVDEKALFKALKEGVIAGAGLDVFENEPIDPNNPLLTLDNIVLTPHISSASISTRTNMAIMAAKNIIAVLQKKMPPNLVNDDVKNVKQLK